MLTSVIYQNEAGTTILLDLPVSIENGQCLPGDGSIQRVRRMLSADPPEHQYPSVEPKGLKRARLLDTIPLAEQEYHQKLQGLITDSLREIRSALGQRQWLRPRQTPTTPREQLVELSVELQAGRKFTEPPVILSSIPNIFSSAGDIADCIVSNPHSLCTRLVVDHHVYHIPPRCTFVLSDVRRPLPLNRCFPSNALHKAFDFIIMDPPWQNRSARHAKAYKTCEGRGETPFLCVLPVLESHLKANGLVGIWVTNKASIRQLVLSSLRQRGFHLYQEWVWVKITVDGDPLTPLHGLWRRPYEVLLLFRKERTCHTIFSCASDISIWHTKVPYRVFVAVPDYHSRKPCLKEFIEPLLADVAGYQALEIFARNLTAGWVCWGNEVLKFNCGGYWADQM